jgi:hypothetical protein
MNMSINQTTSQSINQVNQSTSQVKMYTLNYNPGHIAGHVVLKKHHPVTKEVTVQVGTTWEEHDIGDWRGVHKVQVPVYETKTVTEYEVTWEVYTEEEFKKFEASYPLG